MAKITSLLFFVLTSLIFADSKINQHDILFKIDPTNHSISVEDLFKIETDSKMWDFHLTELLKIESLQINGKEKTFSTSNSDEDFGEGFVKYSVKRGWFDKKHATMELKYSGILNQDTQSASFSREKIAMEINATISEEGVFLSPSAGYYPMADETLVHFTTHVDLPQGWSAVSEGKILNSKEVPIRTTKFKTEHPVEGIFITAAKWDVQNQIHNGVEFYTYFFPEDSLLATDYLQKSMEYVDMYSEMLSPYPFSKFAVVENFFPTGYGMPSYTVLGRSVIHLPFIVFTSLGHEVLHNWWGNSVNVGDGGNWCEGLTTYQADYLYKLKRSPVLGKQYRKDILKDFSVYVNESNDFAPAEFRSRTDMATRSIGYGKVAMIFHMIEEHIGHDAFIKALQTVIENEQWGHGTWSDFIYAFENISKQDLSLFQEAWVNQPGVPLIRLTESNDSLFVVQSENVKPMWIPITVSQSNGSTFTSTLFSNTESTFVNTDGVNEISVDPDYHLMRKLHPEELDMTIRQLLSESSFNFVIPEKNEEWNKLVESFNGYINESNNPQIITPNSQVPDAPIIYLGVVPKSLKNIKVNGSLDIYGNSFDAYEHSVVWAFEHENGHPGLMIYSKRAGELTPLARKVPHYGKYGYLVFNHGNNVSKGNHETPDSPLKWIR
jgi:hypothetical protein